MAKRATTQGFKATIKLNTTKILSDHKKRLKKAQTALDSQVLKDSSVHVPYRTGALKHSGRQGTVFGSGRVIWDIYYAAFVYLGHYLVSGGRVKGKYWFEVAKRRHRKKWEKKANAEYHS